MALSYLPGCIVGDQEAVSYSLRQQTKQDLQRWKQTETLYRNGINWQPAYYILGKKSYPEILRPIWFGRCGDVTITAKTLNK